MPSGLFTEGDASDPAYVNIRGATGGQLQSARWHCEHLWGLFRPHADPNFKQEIRRSFHARYWEMYLTTSLILAGYEVVCPKPGPDVGIVYNGQRIWFEATSPTGGAPSAPDYIAPPETGKVFDVPGEKIILRYLSSIADKYERQWANWLKKLIVSDKDALVIALNVRGIPFEHADTIPPRILQAGYTMGPPYLVIERATLRSVGSGYQFRDNVKKESSRKIPTGVFQREEYAGLSALLCSRVDAANGPEEIGEDFQLAPNPHASVPLPEGFRLRGTYYDVKKVSDGYDVTPI